MSCLTTGAPHTCVEKLFSLGLLAPLNGWRGWIGSEKVPGETFHCCLPEHLALCWLGCGKSWGGCPEQGTCWSITEPRGSFHLRDAPWTTILTLLQLQQRLLQSPRIFSSSYYSAMPFSSVFFTSKSIPTQCILFFVSLTDGFKDSQRCIVNNFSVAWLFPSVHISKPINSLLFSNGY